MIDRFEILNKYIHAGSLFGWEGGWDGHYVCISTVNLPLKLSLTDDLCYFKWLNNNSKYGVPVESHIMIPQMLSTIVH